MGCGLKSTSPGCILAGNVYPEENQASNPNFQFKGNTGLREQVNTLQEKADQPTRGVGVIPQLINLGLQRVCPGKQNAETL